MHNNGILVIQDIVLNHTGNILLYNTENDITGVKENGRKIMADFKTTGKPTFTLIRKLAKIRNENIALRRGDIKVLKDFNKSGIFSFARFTKDVKENIMVLLNTSNKAIRENIDISSFEKDETNLTNILFKEFGIEDRITVNKGKIETSIEPYSMKIYSK